MAQIWEWDTPGDIMQQNEQTHLTLTYLNGQLITASVAS